MTEMKERVVRSQEDETFQQTTDVVEKIEKNKIKPKSLKEFMELAAKMPPEELEERLDMWSGHRMYWKGLPFPNDNLNYFFQLHLSSQFHGGATTGEVFYAASRIDPKNVGSWVKEFSELAQRVEARAESCLQKRHGVSAREAYLRAANYYRSPMWIMSPMKQGAEWKGYLNKSRTCFCKAGALFSPPIEAIDIPFEGKTLPLYFQKADTSGKKCPTLIMLSGGECNAEDGYFFMAPACIKRGYNFVTVDLPGQGGTPFDGMSHRPDSETPVGAVLDYLSSRPDVDTDRIASYGVSMGGYTGPRTAVHDKRLKAVVANSILDNLYDLFKEHEIFYAEEVKQLDPSMWSLLECLAWRWGMDDPTKILAANKDFKYDPSKVTCPVLILIGEGEYNSSSYIQAVQHRCLKALPNPKSQMVIAPTNEGAAHHCLPENLALASQVAFDWLDEVFQE